MLIHFFCMRSSIAIEKRKKGKEGKGGEKAFGRLRLEGQSSRLVDKKDVKEGKEERQEAPGIVERPRLSFDSFSRRTRGLGTGLSGEKKRGEGEVMSPAGVRF